MKRCSCCCLDETEAQRHSEHSQIWRLEWNFVIHERKGVMLQIKGELLLLNNDIIIIQIKLL